MVLVTFYSWLDSGKPNQNIQCFAVHWRLLFDYCFSLITAVQLYHINEPVPTIVTRLFEIHSACV